MQPVTFQTNQMSLQGCSAFLGFKTSTFEVILPKFGIWPSNSFAMRKVLYISMFCTLIPGHNNTNIFYSLMSAKTLSSIKYLNSWQLRYWESTNYSVELPLPVDLKSPFRIWQPFSCNVFIRNTIPRKFDADQTGVINVPSNSRQYLQPSYLYTSDILITSEYCLQW